MRLDRLPERVSVRANSLLKERRRPKRSTARRGGMRRRLWRTINEVHPLERLSEHCRVICDAVSVWHDSTTHSISGHSTRAAHAGVLRPLLLQLQLLLVDLPLLLLQVHLLLLVEGRLVVRRKLPTHGVEGRGVRLRRRREGIRVRETHYPGRLSDRVRIVPRGAGTVASSVVHSVGLCRVATVGSGVVLRLHLLLEVQRVPANPLRRRRPRRARRAVHPPCALRACKSLRRGGEVLKATELTVRAVRAARVEPLAAGPCGALRTAQSVAARGGGTGTRQTKRGTDLWWCRQRERRGELRHGK